MPADEIISTRRYSGNRNVLRDVLHQVGVISDVALRGNEGEVNTILLGQVISFLSKFSSRIAEEECAFDLSAELSKFVKKCDTNRNSNLHACITTIAENAPPSCSLRVLAQLENSCFDSSTFISAIHTSLIIGARDGVRGELSGSMLRIQRAREEGRRPIMESGEMCWSGGSVEGKVENGGFIWTRVLDGMVAIAK